MTDIAITERRRAARAGTPGPSLNPGLIAYAGRHVTQRCVIRDISEHGASITVEGSIAAPDAFELQCAGTGLHVACQVVWRRGRDVGVRFLDAPRHAAPSAPYASDAAMPAVADF